MTTEPLPSVLLIHPDPQARETCVTALRQLGLVADAAARAAEVLSGSTLLPDAIVFAGSADRVSPSRFARDLVQRFGDAAPPVVYLFTPRRGKPSIPSPPLRPGFDMVLERPVRTRDAIRAVLSSVRRSGRPAGVIHVGELDLDVMRRVLCFRERTAQLTRLESLLLEYLMRRAGSVVPIDELLEQVWNFEPGTGAPEVVRAHVRNLRHKLQAIGAPREMITTLSGSGYTLDAREQH